MGKVKPNNWSNEEIGNLEKDHSDIYGVELTYKELCESLGIRYKTGGAKINQLEDLSCAFNILVKEKPKRYVVQDYLGVELIPTPENEKLLEYALMNLFIEYNTTELFYTNDQLLEYFGFVNKNYRVLKHPKYKGRLTDDMIRFKQPAETVGHILNTYMKSTIKRLVKKNKIILREGFCLLRRRETYIDENGKEIDICDVEPVQLWSEEEHKIIEIEEKATQLFNLKGAWCPPTKKDEYKAFTKMKTAEVFGEDYTGYYRVNILTSTVNIAKKTVLDYQTDLNRFSVEKILNTKTLKHMNTYGPYGKLRMIDEIVRIPPICDYKEMLLPPKKLRKKM